jgi:hypothetical protein
MNRTKIFSVTAAALILAGGLAATCHADGPPSFIGISDHGRTEIFRPLNLVDSLPPVWVGDSGHILQPVSFQVTQPPVTLSIAGYYDFKNRHNCAVVITPLRSLTFKGKATGFNADAFVGTVADKDGKFVGGIGIGYSKMVFDQLSFFVDAAISFSAGVPVGGGVVGGLKWDFLTK